MKVLGGGSPPARTRPGEREVFQRVNSFWVDLGPVCGGLPRAPGSPPATKTGQIAARRRATAAPASWPCRRCRARRPPPLAGAARPLAHLSGPLAFSDSTILALGLGPETFKIRPRRAGFQPSDPWKHSFSLREVDDSSPGLEGRAGDQFWHPQGVQVKAPN